MLQGRPLGGGTPVPEERHEPRAQRVPQASRSNSGVRRARVPADWERGGSFGGLGRMTADYLLSVMAWHDDDHLDQLKRALKGRA